MTLLAAFVATGFASSAYHRKRTSLAVDHYNRGEILEKRKELEPALEEFRKALFFSPDRTEYRLSLVTALMEAGRLDEAQSHLEQLSQDDPTNGLINLLMARVAVRQKKTKQAVDDYQRAVYEYWPESDLSKRRQARWELANLLSDTGDRSGSLAELMQLYRNLPANETDQKFKIAWLLLQNGANPEAALVFESLVKQLPGDSAAHRGLATVDFNSGEYVSARHEFQRALRSNPHDKESEAGLALANEVIDIDPMLPYVSSAEQLRRSRNLLERVLKDLGPCGVAMDPPPAPSKHDKDTNPVAQGSSSEELTAAQRLLAEKRPSEDVTLSIQKAAAQVWNDRGQFCSSNMPHDRALDAVFAGINHE